MAPAPASLPTLPDGFESLPVEDAVRVLLRTVIEHDQLYHELNRRHEALVHWIEEE